MLFSTEPLPIRAFPYKANDASMIYPRIKPAIEGLHKLLFAKANFSPNIISIFGLLCIITLLNLSLWGCAGFNTVIGIPFFAPLCALCITLYFIADAMDGMQGKKVGMYEHPLCEIFDHGIDAVAVVAISFATMHLLKASNWAAAMMMFTGLSMTLMAHNEQIATGTFNFPGGLGNVTNLTVATVGLFLLCSFLPIPSIHIPWTNFNLASIAALGSFGYFCTSLAGLYNKSPEAFNLSLPGIASFALALNTWWWSQPHFLNRFTFMGCVAPMLCYIWSAILSKFTGKRLSPQSALIPLGAALVNVYFHSTVKGFFLTCGIFAVTDIYFPAMIYRVASSLKMPHWWSVQLDSEVQKLGKQQKQEEKKTVKQKEKEEREKQMKAEQEEKEKRMIEDEKQGFLTVGKNGRVIHPRRTEEELQQNTKEQPQAEQAQAQPQQQQQQQKEQPKEASQGLEAQQSQPQQQQQQTTEGQQKEQQQSEKPATSTQPKQQQQMQAPKEMQASNVPNKVLDTMQQPAGQAPEGGDSTLRRRTTAATATVGAK
jgi:phosphatidylglycerophosphate synthase